MKKHPQEDTIAGSNTLGRLFLRSSFILIAVALVGLAHAPIAQARQLSEDRGNGNSAAEEVGALNLSTTGSDNTAHGWFSLFSNTSGSSNTADGFQALYNNTVGSDNTANGIKALLNNIGGSGNTATGFQALYSNISGFYNTANGDQALLSNTSGERNTANGLQALYSNTTGNQNTADGAYAMYYNTTGAFNTAIGTLALLNNTTGRHNTGLGEDAGVNLTTGEGNVCVGSDAGSNLTTGDGNVCIGYDVRGVAGEYNTTRVRNIYSSLASGRPVYVDSDNKLGTLLSTRRVKNDIKPMDKASESILALKPVTFRYKKEIEPNGATQFGLIAEEVAEVNADLVILDAQGKPESVRYEAINAMLLNEFLKEHTKVQEQEAKIAQLTQEIVTIVAHAREQDSKIQKVSTELATRISAPQLAVGDR
jgi:Chaperone of endosialidase